MANLRSSSHSQAHGQARDTATAVSTQAPVTDAALVVNSGEGPSIFDVQLPS